MTPFGKTVVGALVIIAIIVGVIYYYQYSKADTTAGNNDQVVCTMDAKLCPDGSYVGRRGPNCEFAACPAGNLKTFSGDGVTFQYPEELSTKYITAVEWPPEVEVTNGPFSCVEGGTESSAAGRTVRETIDGATTYCVTRKSEGAAGSTYTSYEYAFPKGNKVVTLSFDLRFNHCTNYSEEVMNACNAERNTFNLGGIIDQIADNLALSS
jgi:hypothetical protein